MRAVWVIPFEIAFVVGTAAVIPQTSPWLTTYAGSSAPAALLDLAAGAGLMTAGTVLAMSGMRPRTGWVAVLAGATWLASDWIGWQGGIAAVRTFATAAALLYLPLVLHLVALQRRPVSRWIMSRLVTSGYVVAAALGLTLLLFRDPRIDLYCWNNCADDVLLVGSVPWAVSLFRWAVPAFKVFLATSIVASSALILIQGSAASRRAAAPPLLPAVLVGVSSAAYGIALLVDPHEGPRFALHVALFQFRALSAALLAAGLGWILVREWRSRLAVMRLATNLSNTPQPGTVASAMAAEAHDPTLEFLYWLPQRTRYVDAAGLPREVPEEDGRRSMLRVTLAGRLIGLAIHDPDAVDSADLDRLLGPAARLALENERLHAELLVKVDEVRASRARIVATGDAARARAERDLHDGAQQAILAAMYELRAAAEEAETAGDGEALAELRIGMDESVAVLAELREIAHGIHPAVLADRGLGAALRTLADTAAIPVAIGDIPDQRLPDTTERTGYAVVASAVAAATAVGAEELSVRGTREEDRLVLEIRGLGTREVPDILDRVSAADGGWSREGEMLRVWIPCG